MSRLRVQIPPSFLAERKYAVDVLLRDFLGLDYELEVRPDSRDYLIDTGRGRLIVSDGFFGTFDERAGYLDARNLPARIRLVPHPFEPKENLALIHGSDEFSVGESEIRCGLDLFASAFFMLTRWEEKVNPRRDVHNRFLAEYSLAGAAALLDRPIVNEYVELVFSSLQRLGFSGERKARAFKTIASHDVDWPRHWTVRHTAITCAGDLLKRRAPLTALKTAGRFATTALSLSPDPYDTFDWLMDLSDRSGVQSNFNFMTGRTSPHDPPFSFRPRRLRPLLQRVHERGHGIGFHPSYHAYDDRGLWGKEWRRLSGISPQPITVGREHYLRFAAPDTWQIWEDHGMEWDSTLGYADREGFRCGTCYDYPVFNFETRRILKLRELPLTAMDGTLVRYRKLSPEETASSLRRLQSQVKRYRGTFMLLWHNSNLSGPDWLPYRRVYEDFLSTSRT